MIVSPLGIQKREKNLSLWELITGVSLYGERGLVASQQGPSPTSSDHDTKLRCLAEIMDSIGEMGQPEELLTFPLCLFLDTLANYM